jgi:hypothetical protein
MTTVQEVLLQRLRVSENALELANLYIQELEQTIRKTTEKINTMSDLIIEDTANVRIKFLANERENASLRRIIALSEKYNEEIIEQLILICRLVGPRKIDSYEAAKELHHNVFK